MLVSLQNVSKSFGGKEVLRDVTLQVNSGERVGLVGANGVGKTTLLRMVQGDLDPDRGRVLTLPRLKLGFFRQIVQHSLSRSVFDEAASVFEEVHRLASVREELASRIESSHRDRHV